MTETDYLSSDDPAAMLRWLTIAEMEWTTATNEARERSRLATDRKLRLFAVACCRAVWDASVPSHFWDSVAVAERMADELASQAEIEQARLSSFEQRNPDGYTLLGGEPQRAAELLLSSIRSKDRESPIEKRKRAAAIQAALLREICGNPFRPPLYFRHADNLYPREEVRPFDEPMSESLCPVPWLSPAVKAIATSIYESRDFASLPILADAIQEAGCQDGDLVRHLRGLAPCLTCKGTGKRDVMVDAGYNNPLMTKPGWEWCYNCNDGGRGDTPGWRVPRGGLTHCRGCFAIDLLTGRE